MNIIKGLIMLINVFVVCLVIIWYSSNLLHFSSNYLEEGVREVRTRLELHDGTSALDVIVSDSYSADKNDSGSNCAVCTKVQTNYRRKTTEDAATRRVLIV